MPDKYGTGLDPYCYPGTTTLRNLLNIRDSAVLERVDAEHALARAQEFKPDFDELGFAGLEQIHKYLFQDIYDWAGVIRTIDITKGATRFCTASRIDAEANRLFKNLANESLLMSLPLDHLQARVAHYYCELNVLHPFRDGNGRALRLYFEVLMANAGHVVSWEGLSQRDWIGANIAGYSGDLEPLTQIFKSAIKDYPANS